MAYHVGTGCAEGVLLMEYLWLISHDLRVARKNQVPAPCGQLLRGRPVPLFQDVASRRRSQELAAFEGRTEAHKERHGGQLRSRLGRVHYLGAGAGLKCFQVMFKNGSSMTMSGMEVRNRLMPEALSRA
eukprot:767679-Pelagomonas_calceolata.AAC.1